MNIDIFLNGLDEDVEPAVYLKSLICSGKLPKFMQRMDDSFSAWETMCALEEDILEVERRNRFCSPPKRFHWEVGRCDTIQQVPKFLGWGRVGAWLVYDEYVIMVDPPGRAIVIWYDEDFYEKKEATIRGSFPFSDDSAIQMNRVLKAFER